MEEIVAYLGRMLVLEVIIRGLFYATGYVLAPIISLGKWRADSLVKDEKTGKTRKSQTGIELIKHEHCTIWAHGAWPFSAFVFG